MGGFCGCVRMQAQPPRVQHKIPSLCCTLEGCACVLAEILGAPKNPPKNRAAAARIFSGARVSAEIIAACGGSGGTVGGAAAPGPAICRRARPATRCALCLRTWRRGVRARRAAAAVAAAPRLARLPGSAVPAPCRPAALPRARAAAPGAGARCLRLRRSWRRAPALRLPLPLRSCERPL